MVELTAIENKRLDQVQRIIETDPIGDDVWFIHTVLAQCFLPYRDPKARDWHRTNGDYSIILTSGTIHDPNNKKQLIDVGLPYGSKPRLFQSYICTQAIKQQSPVIPVEQSMTAMMKELGFKVTGGTQGSIQKFKEQIIRYARCHYTISADNKNGQISYLNTPPIKKLDVWFPTHSDQETLWPSEIVLTDDYFYSLKDHAIPFDFRGMKAIQSKPRAQDIYIWMTQRLCRLKKPLMMRWIDLYDMFGGGLELKHFKQKFPRDLLAARSAYPHARMDHHKDGIIFHPSHPPIKKSKVFLSAGSK